MELSNIKPDEPYKEAGKMDIPKFDANTVTQKAKPTSLKDKFISFKTKLSNYFVSECNGNENLVDRSNITLLLDEDAQQILITAKKNAILCLDIINRGVVQQIANDTGFENYQVDFST